MYNFYTLIKMELLGVLDSLIASGVPLTKLQLFTYAAIACIAVGVLFFFVGSGLWKLFFRVGGFFSGFGAGFILYRLVIEGTVPSLKGLLGGHIDLIFGIVLGIIAFLLAEHLFRLGLVAVAATLGWIWVPYLVALFLPDIAVSVPYLFDIVGILLGVLLGYILARPLFRPVLVVVSAAIAGLGIGFGSMVFGEGTLVPLVGAASFELIFLATAAAVFVLNIILFIIVAIRKKRRILKELEA